MRRPERPAGSGTIAAVTDAPAAAQPTPTPLADAGIPLGALDGRYRGVVAPLVEHLSEAALNRERVRVEVPRAVADAEVLGPDDPALRLPQLLTFSCLYVDGEALVTALDREGFGVASGSACTASTLEPSHVLAAMGVLTHGNVRVSLTRDTTEGEVDRFLAVLPGVVADLRAEVGR